MTYFAKLALTRWFDSACFLTSPYEVNIPFLFTLGKEFCERSVSQNSEMLCISYANFKHSQMNFSKR